MNEALKKFSADLLKGFQAALVKNHEAISKIKATEDGGSFKVIISTSDEDRQGDALDQSKWKLDNYEKNPVVLWAHNYSEPPIAICTSISVEGGKLVAEGKFAPAELNPFAAQIAGLYEAGFINTTSVGYMQHEDGDLELLEFSFVPVPANPFALSVREAKDLNLDIAQLVMKGISFATRGAVPYKSHGIADTEQSWDGPAQVKACGDDLDKLKSICAWYDAENSDKKSAYKLPHHQASDLKAVWKGVAAAMGALMGSRGGVDIPEADKKAVFSHLAKHYKEFDREVPEYEKAVELFDMLKKTPELMDTISKSPQVGDRCELDDGTPGILAEDENDPGEMVCVPERNKSNETEQNMDNELTKKLKAEHGRHGEAIAKHIDEFSEKCMKGEKAATEPEYEKAIEEFKGAIDAEHDTHLEKCMKAIDNQYETMGREENKSAKKGIQEFKDAFEAEHQKHVKAFHKAIDGLEEVEHPGDGEDWKPVKDAIQEFTEKAADELKRHEKAHMEMCKAEAARMGEGEDEEKALAEAIMKAGRQISAKNKEKIKTIIKALEDHHAEHGKHTDEISAALKELMGPEESGDGKERQDGKSAAQNPRSSPSGDGNQQTMSEFEAYMFARKLLKAVNTETAGGLERINRALKIKFPDRR